MNSVISYIYVLSVKHPYFRQALWSVILLLSAAFIIATAFHVTEVSTSPAGWEKSFLLTPPAVAVKSHQVVSKGNLVVVVYESAGKEGNSIHVTLSFNAGKSFIPHRKLADLTGTGDHNPHVAVSGNGHVAVAWQNIVGDLAKTRLFYSISTDMGAAWSEPSILRKAGEEDSSAEMEMIPRVYYDDRHSLHVYYHALQKEGFRLYHTFSEDEKVFSTPANLIDVGGELRGAFFPEIRYSGANIFLVWQGRSKKAERFTDDLMYIRSSDYGRSWTDSRQITRGTSNSSSPSLLIMHRNVYLAYQDNEEKTWAIRFKTGFEEGRYWEALPQKVSDTQSNCYSPSVVLSQENELSFVWYDLRKGEPGIFVRKYSIPEKKFSDSVMLSKAGIAARDPVAVSAGKHVVVVWREGSRLRLNYSDVYAEPPVVFSRTHPENTWSRASSALIQWTTPADESGIVGYVHVVNKDPNFIPPSVAEPTLRVTQNRITVPDLDDGVSYFHMRSMDGAGNLSRTVHYRIQVSRSPLQVIGMRSTTHPEGKSAPSNSPVLNWNVSDLLRVKGFLCSISKDKIEEPKSFTTDFSIKYQGLEEGRYFFNIRPVDKTNSPGLMENYEIVVGHAEAIDLEYLKEIARMKERERVPRGEGKAPPAMREPRLKLVLPFNSEVPFARPDFQVVLQAINIDKKDIAGYSVIVDTGKTAPGDSINQLSEAVELRNLKNGEYYITAKARYSKIIEGRKTIEWTEAVSEKFVISVPVEVSPVVAYTDSILGRIASKWAILAIAFSGLAFSMVTMGFGTRASFYFRLLRYKIQNLL